MNHVIIIDDEIQSRNGIAEIFKTHSPKWKVAGLFEDGEQALEYLLNHPEINLIVTDIRMPKFDGLGLIKEIRKTNYMIPIIIISGYAEFTYAKRAVDYQVFRYMLKPILPSDFDKVITNVEHFFHLGDSLAMHNIAQSEFDQFMDFLLQEAISNGRKETVHMLEKQCGFSFQDTWFLLLSGNEGFSNQAAAHRPLLKQFANNISPEYHVFLFAHKIFCILIKKRHLNSNFMEMQLKKLLWKFDPLLSIHAGIYCSNNKDSVKTAFYSGISVLLQFFYSQSPVHIKQDQLLCPFPYTIYNNMQLYLDRNNLLDARDTIYSFMDYIKDKKPPYLLLQSWINKYTLLITKYGNDHKVPSSCYIDQLERLEFLYNFYSLEEIELTLLSAIDCIFDKIFEQKNNANAFLLEKVQTYLAQHLKENISLTDLGMLLGINYTFLSNLYSSATGQTIIEYLTSLRISRAKELLINTNLKIYEIGAESGFTDTKYFIKRFRQTVGITPKEYRKIYGLQH